MKMKPHWYSRSRSSSVPATPRGGFVPDAANPGCMSMVHYLIFAPGAGCVGRPPSNDGANAESVVNSASSPRNNAGLEAPRNSLEDDGGKLKDILIGVQIEPAFDALAGRSSRRATAPSSQAETPRTPSLVARLMGIDGLPDQQPSPSPRASKARPPPEKKKRVIPESMNREPLRSLSCNAQARSLPDSPRASASAASARASTWAGVVDRPRLSLQVLKENVLDRAAQYMSMPSSPTSSSGGKKKKQEGLRRRDAEMSTKEHAREIVRQAKETVANRKSGKKAIAGSNNKENVSPIVEDKMVIQVQPPANPQADPQPQRAKPSRPPPPPPPPDPIRSRAVPAPTQAAVKGKKPDGCERFATRIKKPAGATTSQPIPTAAPQPPDRRTHRLEQDPEYGYLRSVLERGGFMRTALSRPFKGHSVASPVDPLVFHLLELDLPADDDSPRLGPLRHRWNRKLLFHLAQEILADLLLGLDASSSLPTAGPPLLAKLWSRVRSFPAADCRVVGDIDALIATDLRAASVRGLVRHPAVAEEAGDVADDVAERVLDALVAECVAESLSCASSPREPS